MLPKKKANGGEARPLEQTEEASVNLWPTQDQIKLRAYQIHLESGARPGQELDDWLRAERELRKLALFTRGWNRLQQRRAPGSQDGH